MVKITHQLRNCDFSYTRVVLLIGPKIRNLELHKPCGEHRVSVQGVKSLSGHFACLCRGFDPYEV